ncbi:MAG: GtrA family protein [Rhodoferax sp.]|nr:GtrA family protein [Rhodoferax sp.]
MSELRAFGRYLAVATVIGAVTVGLREGLGAMMSSLPGHYAWSMILAYGVGVLLSYWAQGRLTFGALGHRPSGQGLRAFFSVALLSAVLTALLAYALRYGLLIERKLPMLAAPLAFASAALLVAPVSFLLGRGLVFGQPAQPAARGGAGDGPWCWGGGRPRPIGFLPCACA